MIGRVSAALAGAVLLALGWSASGQAETKHQGADIVLFEGYDEQGKSFGASAAHDNLVHGKFDNRIHSIRVVRGVW